MHIVNAVFEHGSFTPESPLELPEGSHVRLAIEQIEAVARDQVLSIADRRRIRRRVVERMMRNPLPDDAPVFSRRDMYDRG